MPQHHDVKPAVAYLAAVRRALDGIGAERVDRLVSFLMSAAERGATVHAMGDGGSAALASHLATDLGKLRSQGVGPDVRSLVENPALLTMLANDHGFEEIFSRQLAISARPGDAVIVISGSGRSPNLLRAAGAARERGLATFGLLGFHDGGPLAALVDDAIVVASADYRVIEDVHHSVGHAAAAAMAAAERAAGATVAVFAGPALLAPGPSGAWRPDAFEAVRRLKLAGWTVVLLDEDDAGVPLAAGHVDLVVSCVHGPEGGCDCRRPSTVLLEQAAGQLGLRASDCVIVGTDATDVVLGQRAGARTLLIGGSDDPAAAAPDLESAVTLLIRGR